MRKLYVCFIQFLFVSVFCFCTVWMFGQTAIFVSPSGNDSNGGSSWGDAKKTLAGALEAASGTTNIYMKVGNYTCNNVLIPDGVTVKGGYASTSSGSDTTRRRYPGTNANWTQATMCTILDGNNASRVATVNTDGKLEGCVITHGAVSGNGGGVLVNGGTVQHCVIIQNSALDNIELNGKGGGAYVQNNGFLLNCVVAYNSANNGPGVAGIHGTLINNTITENTAISALQDGQPCPGAATVTDIDGNVYNTVQIGNQCWMKENLRTTRYASGTSIALGSSTSTTMAYRYYPNNNSSNVSTYGYLYNWKAVMRNSSSSVANPSGVQGICPDGWHVPSDAEWTQLTDYVGGQSQYYCSNNPENIAKALASTSNWTSSTGTCTVGNSQSTNNATGFSALPAGSYSNYGYNYSGLLAYFWSAAESSSSDAYFRLLGYGNAPVYRRSNNQYNGYSVRCVRD